MDIINDYEQERTCTYKDELYIVRDNGAVKRLTPGGKRPRKLDNVWTFGTKSESNGYCTIAGHRVHIIVATAFFGERDSSKYVVDHIDTNRCNNRVSNLRWLTKLQNVLLNELTRSKIEWICGSVEEFLKNPSLLRNHEHEDNNFSWMRTVTKEEAENTLKSWNDLINRPKGLQTSGKPIGEWIYGKQKFIAFTPEEEERRRLLEEEKKVQEEKRKEEERLAKEEEKKARAAQRREEAKVRKKIELGTQNAIKASTYAIAEMHNWVVEKNATGNGWKADLLITSGKSRVALRLFSTTIHIKDDLEAMRLDGIKGLWLGSNSCEDEQGLFPSFEVKMEDDVVYVQLSKDIFVPVEKLLFAFMDNRLVVKDYISTRKLKVRFLPYTCYDCDKLHYVYTVCGVICDERPSMAICENMCELQIQVDVFEPMIIKAVRDYLNLHPELDYHMGEIKERYSKTVKEAYLSFGCPYCDSLVGEWYYNDYVCNSIYEPDDEFVHVIELPEPGLQVHYRHWAIE